MARPTPRAPAVAGRFYPADPHALAALVDELLDAATAPGGDGDDTARGFLVPHAAYQFSGPTAAHVYARLRARRDVDRIVLLGPAHFVLGRGCAVPQAHSWLTPLGEVPVDTEGVRLLAAHGLATVDDRPHRPEHSIEVQLPFLQRALGSFSVLPVAVGVTDVDVVAALLQAMADVTGTVVICSSDLSHYLDQATAVARDEATLRAVSELAPRRVGARDACGVYALRGLLGWARVAGLAPRLLERSTSARASGDLTRVVGYAAVQLGARPEREPLP